MKAIVFDTETTGLTLPSVASLKDQPRIIEVGAVAVQDGRVRDTLSILINPKEQITAEITKITGITNEQLQPARTFEEELPTIRAFFEGADMWVAHNAQFDTSMMQFELARADCQDFPWPQEIVCSAVEFSYLFGRTPRMIELYKHFMEKELAQTHRALDDAQALTEILFKAGFL